MKSVCAKHEQAFEDSCPYCEKKAEGPAAAPAAPPVAASAKKCVMFCQNVATWEWCVGTYRYFYCDAHHSTIEQINASNLNKWQRARLP